MLTNKYTFRLQVNATILSCQMLSFSVQYIIIVFNCICISCWLVVWTVWNSSDISLWYDCWRGCFNRATSAWLLSREKTTNRISTGPVHHDPSDTKRLNKTPGCLYKQAGFVTYWCSRKNAGFEPPPVQVVRGNTYQHGNRLWCTTGAHSCEYLIVCSHFILVCMSSTFLLLCLSFFQQGFFFFFFGSFHSCSSCFTFTWGYRPGKTMSHHVWVVNWPHLSFVF